MGRRTQLRLDSEYARGLTLSMEPVRRPLANGFTLLARHLALKIREQTQLDALRTTRVGQTIEFSSTIERTNDVFPSVHIQTDESDKEMYLEFSLLGAELAAM